MSLIILGREIQIVTVPDAELHKMVDGEECLGLYKNETIYIASSLQGVARSRVIVHETVHAVLGISGLTNLIDEDLEEAVCDSVETLVGSGLEL